MNLADNEGKNGIGLSGERGDRLNVVFDQRPLTAEPPLPLIGLNLRQFGICGRSGNRIVG